MEGLNHQNSEPRILDLPRLLGECINLDEMLGRNRARRKRIKMYVDDGADF